MKIKFSIFTLLIGMSFALPAFGCDFCSLYLASQAATGTARGFHFGLSEQFSHFGTLQVDGTPIANPIGQYMDSSITQAVFGYGVNDVVGIQLNVPIIYRSFRRPENGVIEQGSEFGLGDLSLLGKFVAFHRNHESYGLRLELIGGLKFPTGSASRLAEELSEDSSNEKTEGEETLPESGIHGHDLALGSGSWDAIFGFNLWGRRGRFFADLGSQLSVRGRGSFGYRYANEVQWNGGPGAFLLLNHAFTLALQAKLSGEYKGLDDLEGVPAADTGITSVYAGPQILFTWKNRLSAEMGAELPLVQQNTALQIVTDYRIRAGLSGHF